MAGTQPALLAYGLCAIAGVGLCFNCIALAWRCRRCRGPAGPRARAVEWLLRLVTAVYVCDGAALTALVLHRDLQSVALCTAGGYVLLWSLQASLWLLATLAVLLAQTHSRRADQPTTWRFVAVLVAVQLAAAFVAALFAFLPLIGRGIFIDNDAGYFTCMPVRLPGTHSGPYWTLMILSTWLALIVTMAALLVTCCAGAPRTARVDGDHQRRVATVRRTSAVVGINCALWTATVAVVSVGYFSADALLSRGTCEWLVGYSVGVVVLIHPLSSLLLDHCRQPAACADGKPAAWTRPPRRLQSLRADGNTSRVRVWLEHLRYKCLLVSRHVLVAGPVRQSPITM